MRLPVCSEAGSWLCSQLAKLRSLPGVTATWSLCPPGSEITSPFFPCRPSVRTIYRHPLREGHRQSILKVPSPSGTPAWERGEELLCGTGHPWRAVAVPRGSGHFCSPNQSQAPTSERTSPRQSSLRCCSVLSAQNKLEAEEERGEERGQHSPWHSSAGKRSFGLAKGWVQRGTVVRSARDKGEPYGDPG